MAHITKHLTIGGHVQGVFYRAWTVEAAKSQGIVGWVRNRRDGDVEAVVQGDEAVVTRFIEQLWMGPSAARVDRIDISDKETGDFIGFEKRATL